MICCTLCGGGDIRTLVKRGVHIIVCAHCDRVCPVGEDRGCPRCRAVRMAKREAA